MVTRQNWYRTNKRIVVAMQRCMMLIGLTAGIVNNGLPQQRVSKNNSKTIEGDKIFCNPLNLDYRFSITEKSFREAADPMVVYKDDYFLFASKSGGYWWSTDFNNWHFVAPTGLDIEKYAPSVFIVGGKMYYTSSSNGDIYTTDDPKKGTWTFVSHPHNWNDPWIFVDDDDKVYAYYGSGEAGAINAVQLDPGNKFSQLGEERKLILTNTTENGFEVNGDNNEKGNPWTEGASMCKHDGKYYLTYATPGTEKRSYCDAYYVAGKPMGPFTLGLNSPLTHRSLGYVTGTGHGGLFYDKEGKLWTIVTTVISNKAFFERRLALFPADITSDGYLYANTVFGDYPQFLPATGNRKKGTGNLTGWYLLSRGKKMNASSAFGQYSPQNAADDNIKTSWSAVSGQPGEWLQMDLGKQCTINGIQSNFSEVNTTYHDGRKQAFATRYRVDYSADGKKWKTLFDKSTNAIDQPHDFVALATPVKARFVKITNTAEMAAGGYFALSDLRVFGSGGSPQPAAIGNFTVQRQEDRRCAKVSWPAAKNAGGYVIRYGIAPDKLWNHYQVTDGTSWEIKSLITHQSYYFRIDTYNDSAITTGNKVIKAD